MSLVPTPSSEDDNSLSPIEAFQRHPSRNKKRNLYIDLAEHLMYYIEHPKEDYKFFNPDVSADIIVNAAQKKIERLFELRKVNKDNRSDECLSDCKNIQRLIEIEDSRVLIVESGLNIKKFSKPKNLEKELLDSDAFFLGFTDNESYDSILRKCSIFYSAMGLISSGLVQPQKVYIFYDQDVSAQHIEDITLLPSVVTQASYYEINEYGLNPKFDRYLFAGCNSIEEARSIYEIYKKDIDKISVYKDISGFTLHINKGSQALNSALVSRATLPDRNHMEDLTVTEYLRELLLVSSIFVTNDNYKGVKQYNDSLTINIEKKFADSGEVLEIQVSGIKATAGLILLFIAELRGLPKYIQENSRPVIFNEHIIGTEKLELPPSAIQALETLGIVRQTNKTGKFKP